MKLKGYLPRRLAKQKDVANGIVLPRQEDVDGDDDNVQATALGRSWSLESDLRISKVRMSPLTPQDEEPRLGLRVHPGRRFRAEQQQHDGVDVLQYELSRCTTLPLPEDRLYYSQPADTASAGDIASSWPSSACLTTASSARGSHTSSPPLRRLASSALTITSARVGHDFCETAPRGANMDATLPPSPSPRAETPNGWDSSVPSTPSRRPLRMRVRRLFSSSQGDLVDFPLSTSTLAFLAGTCDAQCSSSPSKAPEATSEPSKKCARWHTRSTVQELPSDGEVRSKTNSQVPAQEQESGHSRTMTSSTASTGANSSVDDNFNIVIGTPLLLSPSTTKSTVTTASRRDSDLFRFPNLLAAAPTTPCTSTYHLSQGQQTFGPSTGAKDSPTVREVTVARKRLEDAFEGEEQVDQSRHPCQQRACLLPPIELKTEKLSSRSAEFNLLPTLPTTGYHRAIRRRSRSDVVLPSVSLARTPSEDRRLSGHQPFLDDFGMASAMRNPTSSLGRGLLASGPAAFSSEGGEELARSSVRRILHSQRSAMLRLALSGFCATAEDSCSSFSLRQQQNHQRGRLEEDSSMDIEGAFGADFASAHASIGSSMSGARLAAEAAASPRERAAETLATPSAGDISWAWLPNETGEGSFASTDASLSFSLPLQTSSRDDARSFSHERVRSAPLTVDCVGEGGRTQGLFAMDCRIEPRWSSIAVGDYLGSPSILPAGCYSPVIMDEEEQRENVRGEEAHRSEEGEVEMRSPSVMASPDLGGIEESQTTAAIEAVLAFVTATPPLSSCSTASPKHRRSFVKHSKTPVGTSYLYRSLK
ncbi:hypothetical protein FA10DRAFT_287978 [Acaromyces ingoldii]|uniref:Uncharacterized protein n=1 Tax=Acaromyces ingoldii TaxID=215250 RepID=A0A316YH83_9BASI|nr:hypothetical protein FA10DRAFT_287978 [Acaromyces ingoldii]PWN88436.1 hypothetical protein FA10DRAFT_287978 [Acaromyces ingoldii]